MTATSDYLNKPVHSEREAQLEAENKRMRLALAPFAKAAAIELVGTWMDSESISLTDIAYHIKFGDLRRAARALSTTASRGGEDE